jgi:hypothetical protein
VIGFSEVVEQYDTKPKRATIPAMMSRIPRIWIMGNA